MTEFVESGKAFWLAAILFTILSCLCAGCNDNSNAKPRKPTFAETNYYIDTIESHIYIVSNGRYNQGNFVHAAHCPNPIHRCN